MRAVVLALASAAILAACNQGGATSGDQTAANAANAAFPAATTAYRIEANVMANEGQAFPVVMIRDGAKLRMEFSTPQGSSAIISDGQSEAFMLASYGGRQVAMRANLQDQAVQDPMADWQGDVSNRATRTGACSAAGETGSEWTMTEDNSSVCVTEDGVILSGKDNGRTVWETTRVQRGAQAAELFQLPPGVQVMDMSSMLEQLQRR